MWIVFEYMDIFFNINFNQSGLLYIIICFLSMNKFIGVNTPYTDMLVVNGMHLSILLCPTLFDWIRIVIFFRRIRNGLFFLWIGRLRRSTNDAGKGSLSPAGHCLLRLQVRRAGIPGRVHAHPPLHGLDHIKTELKTDLFRARLVSVHLIAKQLNW